jgi:UDP-4-amino-4,6-dideoxy-N-acetyl-beta-L-altrosamine N-acetyltransferase
MYYLRNITKFDSDKIRKWRNNVSVSKYMHNENYITKKSHDIWFKNSIKDKTRHYWIIGYKNIDVGLINIYDIENNHKRCYWGFYIGEDSFRNKGVGSYAEYALLYYCFDVLKINRLCCEVIDINKRVIEMHKKFGFKEEGIFRSHIIKHDNYMNVHYLALLNKDWNLIKKEIGSRLRAKIVVGKLEKNKKDTKNRIIYLELPEVL